MAPTDGHRQLRRVRTSRLRQRVILACAAIIALLGGWYLLSRTAPSSLRPPPPDKVGKEAVRRVATAAVRTMNSGYAALRPHRRDTLKHRFLAALGKNDTSARPQTIADSSLPAASVRVDSTASSIPGRYSVPRKIKMTTSLRTEGEINILLIGLDARLGRDRGRADALHLCTIAGDQSRVTITSIPRGTPYELGYENPSANIISSVRSARGRDALLRAVAKLSRIGSVPYFVEVGFSQAIGILRLFGYADPMQELQALRTRKGYTRGDVDRSINQGRFIRRAIPRLLPKFEGLSGELLLSAALAFVETNLQKDFCLGLLYALNDAGIATPAGMVEQKVYGAGQKRLNHLLLPDDEEHAVGRADYSRLAPTTRTRAERLLRDVLAQAARSGTRPRAMIPRLRTMFQQRCWHQIPTEKTRTALRDSLATVLKRACAASGDSVSVRMIEEILRSDDILFRNTSF
jgi:hypothetical protein